MEFQTIAETAAESPPLAAPLDWRMLAQAAKDGQRATGDGKVNQHSRGSQAATPTLAQIGITSPHWRLMVSWLAAEHPLEPDPLPADRDPAWRRRHSGIAADDTVSLLSLIGAATATVSTTRCLHSTRGIGQFRGEPDFPRHLRHRAVHELLLAAETAGLLGRRPYRDSKNIGREAWVLTPAGRERLDGANAGGEG